MKNNAKKDDSFEYYGWNCRERKDGRWEARKTDGRLSNGKLDRKSMYAPTKLAIKKKIKALFEQGAEKLPSNQKKQSLAEYMLYWLNTFKRVEVKPSTFDRLEITIKNNCIPATGHIQVHAVVASDIQNHLNQMKDNGYSYSTIKKAFNAYSACFNHAIVEHVVDRHPCIGVKLPRKKDFNTKEIAILTPEEEKIFILEAMRRHGNGSMVYRLGFVFVLMLHTGIRVGEALALKWSKVDFEKNRMLIDASISLVKNRKEGENESKYVLHESDPKSESGVRYIPLNKVALEALKQIKNITIGSEYILTTKSDKILLPRDLTRTINCIYDSCEIARRGIHALRHTFATKLFAKKEDIKVISKLLGHSDVQITYDTYIHLFRDEDAVAVASLESDDLDFEQLVAG